MGKKEEGRWSDITCTRKCIYQQYVHMLLTYVHAKMLTEGSVLFNDVLSTFYLCLYGVGHMAKNHLDSDRGNPLPALHGLLF